MFLLFQQNYCLLLCHKPLATSAFGELLRVLVEVGAIAQVLFNFAPRFQVSQLDGGGSSSLRNETSPLSSAVSYFNFAEICRFTKCF